MASGETSHEQQAGTDSHNTRDKKRWYQRPTLRTLKKRAVEDEDRDFTRKWDERGNDETRLPDSEEIHLGGFVLTEAFTPSTVSSLYDVLEQWPNERRDKKSEWLQQLARSRAGHRGGWQNLGVIRQPGAFIMGDGHHDPDLPTGVEAVWLHVNYVIPSVAMVVATFTLSEDAGDLSALLRRNYRTRHVDPQVRVYGRFGDLRARVPWARPAAYGLGYGVSNAEDEKRKACEALIREREEACSRWFFAKFHGRFAVAKPEDRPVIRMLFTREQRPFVEKHGWLRPAGLEFTLPLWRSTDPEGWWLSEDRWPDRARRHAVTLAAKRSDAAKEPGGDESGESNWYLTQRFGSDQAPLAARQALMALLALYADRLAALRDEAGVDRRIRRPVHEGHALDDYLIRDGLDAATLTSDLDVFTNDLTVFRWGVPEFIEHREHLPEQARGRREPMDYLPSLCRGIREQAARLAGDTRTTTENIRASAELRQAIANTRLQRLVIVLTLVAVAVAVIGVITTGH